MKNSDLDPIIVFDIEATHLKSNFGHVISFGYKELGKKTKVLSIRDYQEFKKKPWDDSRLLEDSYDILAKAGAWVTYFGTGFDIPFLQSRMLKAGIGILPPVAHIDVYKIAKQYFPLHSRRLGVVGQFLGCAAEKTPLEPEVWERAQYGSIPDLKYIDDHCYADVDLLEEVYLKTRGLDQKAPLRTRLPLGTSCNRCGSTNLEYRGFAYTRAITWRRFQCKNVVKGIPCGAWGRLRVKQEEAAA